MANRYESAQLLLKLYELRREDTMRRARNWFMAFHPSSAQEIFQVVRGEKSAYYRMVTSYWEMAASFVHFNVIDAEMFAEASREPVAVFAKVAPFLEEVRTTMGHPGYLKYLEEVVMGLPGAEELLDRMREQTRLLAQPKE